MQQAASHVPAVFRDQAGPDCLSSPHLTVFDLLCLLLCQELAAGGSDFTIHGEPPHALAYWHCLFHMFHSCVCRAACGGPSSSVSIGGLIRAAAFIAALMARRRRTIQRSNLAIAGWEDLGGGLKSTFA